VGAEPNSALLARVKKPIEGIMHHLNLLCADLAKIQKYLI